MAVAFPFLILSIILTSCQGLPLDSCNNPSCLREAERINAQIDPNINPCDNFYQFACGKFLEGAKDVEKPGKFEVLAAKTEKEILELYKEPVKFEEHEIVKSAKKLFQACINVPKIEEDNLKTIKEVLKIVGGGWPLIEGSKWDEATFDWLQATYKLRVLGYPYSIFLDLKVKDDPRNKTQSLFQVILPNQFRSDYQNVSEYRKTINKIVAAMGVDIHNASKDLDEMVEFEESLREKAIIYQRRLESYPTYTINEIQNTIGSINWLEFINGVSGPAAQISSEDSVIVLRKEILKQWLGLIGTAPKRTQANYLMWKLVEEMIPYLTSELRNLVLPENELEAPRDIFCLNTTQERFTPSPINIIYSRKSFDKKKQVEEIVWNIRDALLTGLDNSWLYGEIKETVADRLRNMVLVIGEPDGNDEKSLLDELIVDMREVNDENFLNLLSRANRNHISSVYGRVKKTKHDKQLNDWYSIPSAYNIQFKREANVLSIPTSQLEQPVLNENRPDYFNYGILGKEIGKHLASLLFATTEEWPGTITKRVWDATSCLITDIEQYQGLTTFEQVTEIQSNIVGAKLAHAAYQKWAEDNKKEELKLLGTNYTTEQLFWISTVDCKYIAPIPAPTDRKGIFLSEYEVQETVRRSFPGGLVVGVMRNILDVGKEFKCPLGSPMNPSDRCTVF